MYVCIYACILYVCRERERERESVERERERERGERERERRERERERIERQRESAFCVGGTSGLLFDLSIVSCLQCHHDHTCRLPYYLTHTHTHTHTRTETNLDFSRARLLLLRLHSSTDSALLSYSCPGWHIHRLGPKALYRIVLLRAARHGSKLVCQSETCRLVPLLKHTHTQTHRESMYSTCFELCWPKMHKPTPTLCQATPEP